MGGLRLCFAWRHAGCRCLLTDAALPPKLSFEEPAHTPARPPCHAIAVLETLAAYEAQGLLTYTAVPSDSEGRVSAANVAAAIREETCLVTLMHR